MEDGYSHYKGKKLEYTHQRIVSLLDNKDIAMVTYIPFKHHKVTLCYLVHCCIP